jgi:hypothetical protein
MSSSTLRFAMNIWSISDVLQKQSLMRKFLEKHGDLQSKNDFLGFLDREFDRQKQHKTRTMDIIEQEG